MDPPIQTEYLRSGGATILTWHLVLQKTDKGGYFHGGRGEGGDFLLHPVCDTGVHGGATRLENR